MVAAAASAGGVTLALLYGTAPETAMLASTLAPLSGLAAGAGAATGVFASGHGSKPRAAAFAAVGALAGPVAFRFLAG